MTSASPTDGRRDNGLPSAEWGALVDVDPRLSEALLDSLAAEGVAAFVEPARDTDSYTRATVLPKRPLDRLWVDPSRADLARGVVSSEVADLTALLAEQDPGANAHGLVRPVPRSAASRVLSPPELPGPPGAPPVLPPAAAPADPPAAAAAAAQRPSDDELFRQIVEGFALEASDPVPRWPVSEDLSGPGKDATKGDSPRRRRQDAPPPVENALPSWVEPEKLEDEGHFDPPPAPKVPRLRPRTAGALALLLLGLVALFRPGLILLDGDPLSIVIGLLFTGGGAGLLVAWMRDAPGTGSGPDDGAVV